MRFKKMLASGVLFFLVSSCFASNYYWVGGSGNWSDLKHWSSISGGTSYYLQVPTPSDDIYFDENSFITSKDTVNVNVGNAVCRNMDWTTALKTPSFLSNTTFRIYGSLKLISAMNWLLRGSLYFEATSTGKTITSSSNVFLGDVYFNGIGGEWILQDSLLLVATKGNGSTPTMLLENAKLYLNNGHLNTNSKFVYTNQFNSINQGVGIRQLTIANSTIKVLNGWQVDGNNITINAINSTIFTNSFSHNNNGKTYYNLLFENGGSLNTNYCKFHTVTFNSQVNNYPGGHNNFDSLILKKGVFQQMNPTLNNDTIQVLISHESIFIGNGCKIGTANLFDKGTIYGSNVYDTLILNPGGYYIFGSYVTQLVNKAIVANGVCTANISIESSQASHSATISKSSGIVNLNYVSLKDIKAIGGANYIASNAADLGNNTGVTINTAISLNLYWIGGSGNWNDPNHWSFTSGGAGGGCLPTANDNVYFDSKSFNSSKDTIKINVGNAVCKDMDWTGATNKPSFLSTNDFKIYGYLKLISPMNWLHTGKLYFEATTTGKKITSSSNIFKGDVIFNGIGGEWILQDSLITGVNGSINTMPISTYMYHNNGHLNTNGNYVKCDGFYSTNYRSRKLTIANSTFRASGICQVYGDSLTLNAQNSLLITNYLLHNGEKKTYYDVLFENGGNIRSTNCTFHTVTINAPLYSYMGGGNHYDSLLVNKGISETMLPSINSDTIRVLISKVSFIIGSNCKIGSANLFDKATLLGNNEYDILSFNAAGFYTLGSGATQIVNNSISANGSCTANISFESTTSGTIASLSKSSGAVNFNYASLKDIRAIGGATFIANNTANLGNNSGWTINSNAPLQLYWVGGGGNWSDANHWSATSGGTGGSCIPTANDDVYFDEKSFISSTDTVNVTAVNGMCKNMDWTGALKNPSFKGVNAFKIYGSLKLINAMNWLFSGSIYFESITSGNKITSSSKSFKGDLYFNGIGGEWILQDSLQLLNSILGPMPMPLASMSRLFLYNGHLNTNSKYVNCSQFTISAITTAKRTLTIANSTINVLNTWQADGTNFALNAQNSTIITSNFNHIGEKKTYNDLKFPLGGSLNSSLCTYRSVTFNNQLNNYAGNGNKFDSLILNYGINQNTFSILNSDTIRVLFSRISINIGSNCKVGIANLFDKATMNGSNMYDTLLFNPGGFYKLAANATQTVIDSLRLRGNGCFPITLQSTISGTQSTISYTKNQVIADFIEMRDQKAVGGAIFFAGKYSTDVSNNNGWSFNNAPEYIYGLGRDTTFCGSAATSFFLNTDNFNGGIAWNWQDGSTAPTCKVDKAGKYFVQVTFANNCFISDTINVGLNTVVFLNPIINIATPITTLCTGTKASFTASATDTGSEVPNYQWKINGNKVGNNSQYFTSSLLNNLDTITCDLTINNSCKTITTVTSNKIPIVVSPDAKPAVSIIANTSKICIGENLSFVASASNIGDTTKYAWKVNGITVDTTSSSYNSTSLKNNDVVSVAMTSNTACATSSAVNSNSITVIVNSKVTPAVTIATPTTTICSGESMAFSATFTDAGSAPSYLWKINGANAGSDSILTSSSINNNDIITLQLTSNNNCVTSNIANSNSILVTISSKLTPTISVTASNISICDGSNINFTTKTTHAGASPTYQWKINGNNVGTNSNLFSSTQLKNSDVVSVILLSSLTCVTQTSINSNTIILKVNPLVTPTVNISGNTSNICIGSPVSFTSSTTNTGDTTSYIWKINGVASGITSANFTTSNLANNDIISVQMTSNTACATNLVVNSNTIKANVVDKLIPSISISTTSTKICSGDGIDFTAITVNGGSAPIYQWKVNNINTVTSASFSTSLLNDGDIVSAELTSNNSCQTKNISNSNSIVISVTTKLEPTVTIQSAATNNCDGTKRDFTASISNGGASPSYQWKINGVNIGTNNNTFSSNSIKNMDKINVVMTSNLPCLTKPFATSNDITAIVNPLVTPTIKINASASTICAGAVVNFTTTTTNEGLNPTYQWKVNNLALATGPAFSSATLLNNDIVSVGLTSNASCVTSNTASDNISILVPTINKPIVSVGKITDFTLEFVWNAVVGATSYEVSIDGGVSFQTPSSGSSGTQHIIKGLSPDFAVTILVKTIGVFPCVFAFSNSYSAKTSFNKTLFVPNVFTPNGDGVNDYFMVYGTILDFRLMIYNQWGTLVFSSTNQKNGWDGTKENKPQPAGPYSYYLEALLIGGNRINQKGNFTLVR